MIPATPDHKAKRLTKFSAVSSRDAPSASASSVVALVDDVDFCAMADPFWSFQVGHDLLGIDLVAEFPRKH
jgi:hypothetical protein